MYICGLYNWSPTQRVHVYIYIPSKPCIYIYTLKNKRPIGVAAILLVHAAILLVHAAILLVIALIVAVALLAPLAHAVGLAEKSPWPTAS